MENIFDTPRDGFDDPNKKITDDQDFYKNEEQEWLTKQYLVTDPKIDHMFTDAASLIDDVIVDMVNPPAASHFGRVFEQIDRAFFGLRPHEFTILCGATGTGKSTFCANISKGLLLEDIPHQVFSVENGDKDFVNRVASAIDKIDYNTGEKYRHEVVSSLAARKNTMFKKNMLHVAQYDNRVKVERIMSDIYAGVVKHGVKVAIIDNLNFLMEVTRAADQIVEMDRVIHELIIFCKRVPIHIIMVMHPRKTDGGRVESEFDIKGSSTAVQEAQNIVLFNRAKSEDIDRFANMGVHGSHFANQQEAMSLREVKIAKLRRRGRFAGKKIFLKTSDGVSYVEIKHGENKK